MKINLQYLNRFKILSAASLIFVIAVFSAQAATHTIIFGGEVGNNYLPNQLDLAVGDTVIWSGSFSFHPLVSVSVPQGAGTFNSSSGTTFSYTVLVAGTYNYKCNVHTGMNGSFTATVTGLHNAAAALQPNSFELAQNYPNPFNARTVIKFNLPVAQQVKLKVYSVTGAEVATLLDGFMPAGEFTVPFDAGTLASGVYFYQLMAERYIDTKRLVLAR